MENTSMNATTMERLMGLLDGAISEMTNSTANEKSYEYLCKAMSIVERAYYTSDIDKTRQMELDFSKPNYNNIPESEDD